MRHIFALVVFGALCLVNTASSNEDDQDVRFAEVNRAVDFILANVYPPVDEEKCRPLLHNAIVAVSPHFGAGYWDHASAHGVLRREDCLDQYSVIIAAPPGIPEPEVMEERLFKIPLYPKPLRPAADFTGTLSRMPMPHLRPRHGQFMTYFEGEYAYLRVPNFLSEKVQEDFAADVLYMTTRRPAGIVLDLRENPGGLVYRACDTLEVFAPEASVAVTEVTRSGTVPLCEAHTAGPLARVPIAILANKYTASASEMVMGTLKRWYPDSTVIIGDQTFGKGVIQNVYANWEVALGITVEVTSGEYFPGPDTSVSVHGVGITPDIMDLAERDQVAYAVEVLKQRRLESTPLPTHPPVALGQ